MIRCYHPDIYLCYSHGPSISNSYPPPPPPPVTSPEFMAGFTNSEDREDQDEVGTSSQETWLQLRPPGPTVPTNSGEIRVVTPPEKQPAGVWFLLRAAHNQAREPFLPQICKSYIRIKDGRMTIRLLKKYLVSKLGLEHESEVEISCRGQRLLPLLTLQHVRDNIWKMHETSTSLTLVQESSYSDHLMTLQYGRSS